MSQKSERRILGIKRSQLMGSSDDKAETIIHVCGVAAIAILGTKFVLPVLGKLGKLLTRGRGAPRKAAAPVPTGPSEDKWNPMDAPPPAIPSDFKLIATGTLPCSVKEFFERVVSSQTDCFQSLHEKCGPHREVTASGWKASGGPGLEDNNFLQGTGKEVFDYVFETSGSGGFTRTLTFIQPKKPPASVDSDCVQRQQFCVYKGDMMIFSTVMNMLNIPFKECFTVNTAWVIKPEGDGSSCSITVNLKVNFVKSCMVGSIIRASTNRDTSLFYKGFINEASVLLGTPAPPPGTVTAKRSSMMSRGASASAGGPPNTATASRMELTRHLRVLFVVVIIVGSLVHQLSLHQQMELVHRFLGKE